MSVKVTVKLESVGDKKATLRIRHKPPEGEEETREVVVGPTSTENVEVYDLKSQSYVAIEVYQIAELIYDKDQAALVEGQASEPMATPKAKSETKTAVEGHETHRTGRK